MPGIYLFSDIIVYKQYFLLEVPGLPGIVSGVV